MLPGWFVWLTVLASRGDKDKQGRMIGPFPEEIFNQSYLNYRWEEGCLITGANLWQGHTYISPANFPFHNMHWCTMQRRCASFAVYIRPDTQRNQVFISYKHTCSFLPRDHCSPPYGMNGGGVWFAMLNTVRCPGLRSTAREPTSNHTRCREDRPACAQLPKSDCSKRRVQATCPRRCETCAGTGLLNEEDGAALGEGGEGPMASLRGLVAHFPLGDQFAFVVVGSCALVLSVVLATVSRAVDPRLSE